MKSNRLRRFGPWVFLTALAILMVAYLKRNPLVGAAHRLVAAMSEGKADVLYDATIPDERGCSELTPEKVQRVWGILIHPRISESRFVRDVPIELAANQTQAVGEFRYINRHGEPWTLPVIANQSDDGAKTGLIYGMLAVASLFDENGHAKANITSELALKAERRYRSRLESVGISKVMLAPGSCVTWDQLDARLQGGISYPPANQ